MIILLLAGMATAIIDEQGLTLDPDDVYIEYLRFSFMEGGKIETDFDISTSVNTDLGFYLCSPSQIDDLEDTFEDTKFCTKYDSASYRGCDYHARIPAKVDELSYLADKTNFTFDMYMEQYGVSTLYLNDTQLLEYEAAYIDFTSNITSIGTNSIDVKVNRTTAYYFVLTNCAKAKIQIDVDYEVVNPGGEQLSVGYLELKHVMLAAKICWGLIFLAWLFTWLLVKFRRPKLVQVMLTFDAAVWTAYAFVEHKYWLDFSNEGVPNHLLECVSYGLLSFAEALFYASMVLLACGVGIVHRLHIWILACAFLAFCLVIAARILLHFKGEIMLYGFAAMYMSFLVGYMLLIHLTCLKLHKQLAVISSIDLDPVGTDVWHRLRMFRIVRVTLMILMPLLSVCYIITFMYLAYYPWIAAVGHISAVILTYFVLFLYLRFKRDDVYLGQVIFKLEDIPEFSLKDIKDKKLPEELFNPFSVLCKQSYPKDKVIRIVPEPVIIALKGHHKVFLGFDLDAHVQTYDIATDIPDRAKLYECDESIDLIAY